MLHRWSEDRQGRQQLLRSIAERWEQASSGGALEPHTYLHQPQGRLAVDLHGFSPWTAQVCGGPGGQRVKVWFPQDRPLALSSAGQPWDCLLAPPVAPALAQRAASRCPALLQLVVLGVLHRLLAVHQAEQGGIAAHLSRVDLITGRGNRRCACNSGFRMPL